MRARDLVLWVGRVSVLGMLAVAPGCRCNRVPPGGVVLVREGGMIEDNVRTLASDADHVYYVAGEHGSGWRLKRVAKAGGIASSLTEVKTAIQVLRVATDAVYFTTNGALHRVPKDGGAAVRLLEAADLCPVGGGCGMAVDDTHVYVTTKTGIVQMPRTGGLSREIVGGLSEAADVPAAVTTDATHVYWIHSLKRGVFRVPKAGGAIETVTMDGFDVGADPTLVVSNGFVYYLSAQTLYRAPVAGGPATLIAKTGSHGHPYRGGFQVVGDTVYFTRSRAYIGAGSRRSAARGRTEGEGGLMKAPAAGGAPVWLARGVDQVYALEADEENVYFATDKGQVIRLDPSTAAPAGSASAP